MNSATVTGPATGPVAENRPPASPRVGMLPPFDLLGRGPEAAADAGRFRLRSRRRLRLRTFAFEIRIAPLRIQEELERSGLVLRNWEQRLLANIGATLTT